MNILRKKKIMTMKINMDSHFSGITELCKTRTEFINFSFPRAFFPLPLLEPLTLLAKKKRKEKKRKEKKRKEKKRKKKGKKEEKLPLISFYPLLSL